MSLAPEPAHAGRRQAPRQRVEQRVSKESATEPAKILRAAAVGADTLVVVTAPQVDPSRQTLLTVSDEQAIAEWLALIDTLPKEDNVFSTHLCRGHPQIRLYPRGQLAAEVSFDHVKYLRPYSESLWPDGDAELTESSARSMAAWFKRHGLSMYQDQFDHNEREAAKREAFLAAFPPKSMRRIQRRRDDWITFSDRTKDDGPCKPGSQRPLSQEVRDPVERIRVICRGLGPLRGSWSSYDEEEGVVLEWARCAQPEHLAPAVEGLSDATALRGAARILFGAMPNGRRWLTRLQAPVAERLALRVAPLVFLEDDQENAPRLPRLLSTFRSDAITNVLQSVAAGAAQLKDAPCGEMAYASAPLSALVVLAERRRADPDVAQAAMAREWQCATNRAAADTATALTVGDLPSADDLASADETTLLMALRRLQEDGSREAIDVAFAVLLDGRWGIVHEETRAWLQALSGVAGAGGRRADQGADLRWWWKENRNTWRSRKPQR